MGFPARQWLADFPVRRAHELLEAEARKVLADGITRSETDINLAMVLGTGFPPFRGGLV
jgi:3-hydroxyacyl-CoA dehydrogenase/enoyl-CoA hydratase/3-hydroxybutyryl-CoA epimerase